jgi:RHS repeat-associated protein
VRLASSHTTNSLHAFSAYRFHFNGQEADNEVAGNGNSYTAEFWQYDSRLGRRWNVDPKPIVSFSPYMCLSNNPILFIDKQGDTSKYYNSNGELIHIAYDHLPYAVVVIPLNNTGAFYHKLEILGRQSKDPQKALNGNAANRILRSYGKSYLFNTYRNFYNKHKNDIHNETVLKPDDGKGPLIDENSTGVQDVNGEMLIVGNPERGTPKSSPNNYGTTTSLHTHASDGRHAEVVGTGKGGKIGGTDSDTEKSNKNRHTGILDIIVTSDSIILLDKNGPVITERK